MCSRGELAFRCGDETFEVADGGFVFCPWRRARLSIGAAVTSFVGLTAPAGERPAGGWGGLLPDFGRKGSFEFAKQLQLKGSLAARLLAKRARDPLRGGP